MKLCLANFRKFSDHGFEFGDNITKISGESGTGKSTLFAAIVWCLYGKIRDVKSKGKDVSPRVTFEIDVMYKGKLQKVLVDRTGMKTVFVTLDGVEYGDNMAQSLIHDIFGTYEVFLLTSYLPAETMHSLISASPSEKRELTGLLFPDAAKHDRYRDKLVSIRRNDESNLLRLRTQIAAVSSSISTLEASNSWLGSEIPEEVSFSEGEMLAQLRLLLKERDDMQKTSASFSTLQSQYSALPEPIDTTEMQEEYDSLQKRLLEVAIANTSKDTQVSFLKEKMDTLVSSMNEIKKVYGDITCDEAKRLLRVLDELLSMAPSLPVLEESYSTLGDKYATDSRLLIEYENSLDAIEHNRKLDDILTCPKCSASLRHTTCLVAVEETISPRDVQHKITASDVSKLRIQLDRLEEKRNSVMKQIEKYSSLLSKERTKYPFLMSTDYSKEKERLRTYLQLCTDFTAVEKELMKVQSDTREYISSTDHQALLLRSKELNRTISDARATLSTRTSLSASIEKMKSTYSYLDNVSEKMMEIDARISTLRTDIQNMKMMKERMKVYTMYQERKKELETYNSQLPVLESRLSASARLESILASTYQEYVGKKLKEIEYDVCILGKAFFDETMNITLTSGKETSTGIIRPSFDLKVEYGDMIYEDIRGLSTGERKRLSLILMIVLTKYMDGKFMLLDEALASVSMDARGIILSELSKLGIPILLSGHDDIPGSCDGELNLNKL